MIFLTISNGDPIQYGRPNRYGTGKTIRHNFGSRGIHNYNHDTMTTIDRPWYCIGGVGHGRMGGIDIIIMIRSIWWWWMLL